MSSAHNDNDAPEEQDDELEEEPGFRDGIQATEDLALAFLSQMNAWAQCTDPDTSAEDDDPSAIKLQIADRSKDEPGATRSMTFPKKSATGSARPLAQLFRVLDSMHDCVVTNIPATKRDIYYTDVPLFKTQRVVDTLVDDLAATADLQRSELNIRATSKGLICGSAICIDLVNGSRLQPSDSDGSLIPVGEDIQTFSLAEPVSWVLIVEKDAIFQHLCRLLITNHPMFPGRGILITGKGYPDMATRHLVKTLSDNLSPSVPILALVDADPFGLDILSVYKYGSRALRHENDKLAASRAEWVGLFASELAHLDLDRDALIPISKHDEKKALSMLRQRGTDSGMPMPVRWRKELMHMLHSRRKAEIEILYTAGHGAASDSAPETAAPPLLLYLAKKIADSVSGSVAAHA